MMMMNIQPSKCVRSAVQLEMCVYVSAQYSKSVQGWYLSRLHKASKCSDWQTEWGQKSAVYVCVYVCVLYVYVFEICSCVCLCLCCVKWNGQQAFWVAQGTLPSDWSDKGRRAEERGTRIDPVMNEQGRGNRCNEVLAWYVSAFYPLWYIQHFDMFVVNLLCCITDTPLSPLRAKMMES